MFLLRKNNKKLAELLVRFSINQKKKSAKVSFKAAFHLLKIFRGQERNGKEKFLIMRIRNVMSSLHEKCPYSEFSGPFFLAFGVENLRIRTLFT